MKIKTSELIKDALDWAVAKCKNLKCTFNDTRGIVWLLDTRGEISRSFNPSSNWSWGGPIIEREKITVEYTADPDTWCACIMADQEVYGPTPLIAAMRCYVASKLGDTVDIPEELC